MDKIKEFVKNELDCVEKELYSLFKPANTVQQELINYLKNPSKRIRSILGILYLKANNKAINDDIIKVLTAGEIIHNASLLHDDVLDNSSKRRNLPSFNAIFTPNTAILSGDYLLTFAINKLLMLDNKQILNEFLDCTKNMTSAEINQYLLKGRIPSEEEYIDICIGKTAMLFTTVLKSCSYLTGLADDSAYKLGINFGILFQIANDESESSILSDKENDLHTACDVFGLEKTSHLKDNYKKEAKRVIETFPNKEFSRILEDLVMSI